MNTASLALSKELYELTRWMDTEKAHYLLDGKPRIMRWSKTSSQDDDILWSELILQAPAYDLGYLLRKLPKKLPHPMSGSDYTLGVNIQIDNNKWNADYQRSMLPHAEADTPEDAACKLAIELIKQGILK